MKLQHYFYVPEAQAREYGAKAEGTLFGVGVWIRHYDDEMILAFTKVPLLGFYIRAMDWLFEALCVFLPQGAEIETPLKDIRDLP